MADNFYLDQHKKEDQKLTKEVVDNLFNEAKPLSWDWNTDPYVELAANIHNIPVEDVTPKQRSSAKTIMYGSLYS